MAAAETDSSVAVAGTHSAGDLVRIDSTVALTVTRSLAAVGPIWFGEDPAAMPSMVDGASTDAMEVVAATWPVPAKWWSLL